MLKNLFHKIKSFFNVGAQMEFYNKRQTNRLLHQMAEFQITEHALHDTEMGVTEERLSDTEVIVSLTTFGKRIFDVYLTIESIMQGTVKPNRIILWISEEYKGLNLPIVLQKQMKRGLQVEYCKDIRSYTKLIPTLKKYPNAAIITLDDDAIYKYDLVEKLIDAYKAEPQYIHANRIHRIKLNLDGSPAGYNDWEWCSSQYDASPLNFLTGVGGVLYPPHCFDEEVFREDIFMDICKYADDVWFYFMALKNGCLVKKVYTHQRNGEDFIMNEDPAEEGLLTKNTSRIECRNDIQIKAVMEKYKILKIQ